MPAKWFKNLQLFHFQQPLTITVEELQQKLATTPFYPCGPHERSSQGWIAPFAESESSLVYQSSQCILFTLRRQEKLLPTTTVRDAVTAKVSQIETVQSRKVGKREKNEIKEQVIYELLSRAFTQNTDISAYIDLTHQWLVVDISSRKKAEELVSFLRVSLETLPVAPLVVQPPPLETMTAWLKQRRPPKSFTFGEDCKLITDDGESVTCKQLDLLSTEVQEHLKAGKSVQQLALQWNERVAFVLDHELTIRRIKLLDIIQEQYEHLNDAQSNFSIMTLELAKLLQALLDVLTSR